jgi:hypothetical protein
MIPKGPPGQTIATNQILTLNNLQLAKAGGYMFVIFVNNDLKTEIPLGIEVNPAPASMKPGHEPD